METSDEDPEEQPEGFFNNEDAPELSSAPLPDDTVISWTASEFIAHAKSIGWYSGLLVVTAAIAALVFLITKDVFSTGVIVVGGLLFGIYGAHQPRQLQYQLDASGLTIAQKHFGYHDFRSFCVVAEGAFDSIIFMPLKRFGVPVTVYFPPEQKDQIVELVSGYLPLENAGHDAIDRFLQRIRF